MAMLRQLKKGRPFFRAFLFKGLLLGLPIKTRYAAFFSPAASFRFSA
jgi:hypothetical protein